jgi:DNA-binding MarR family transcriptional regulator
MLIDKVLYETTIVTDLMQEGPADLALISAGDDAGAPDFDSAGGSRLRCLGHVALPDLGERLGRQLRLDILWLNAAAGVDGPLAEQIRTEVKRLGARVICEMDGAALDAAFAEFAHLPGAQFLCRPEPIDRSLALVAAQTETRAQVADSGREVAMERIDQLQDEVARIAALLTGMTEQSLGYRPRASNFDNAGPISFSPAVRDTSRVFRAEPDIAAFSHYAAPTSSSAAVRRLLRQRRMREQFFPADLFADPAWDMLLDLYAAQLEGQPVAVSSLCIAAAVPATTALRWIKTMTDTGLFERQADPRDGRRIFIGLAPQAAQAMERYFAALDAVR